GALRLLGAVIAALFTSFYSWRLMFLTFYGSPRGDKHTHDHAHESPKTMLIPLGALAVGAVFAGMVWYKPFFGDHHKVEEFFGIPTEEVHAAAPASLPMAAHAATETAEGDESHDGDESHPLPGEGAIYMAPDNTVLDDAHHVPAWVIWSPFIAMLLGLAGAYQMYIRRPDWPAKLAANQRPLYLFLLNKWYFDEIYNVIFVQPAKWLGGFLWHRGDGNVIDGGINGLAMGIIPFFTRLAGRAQSGYIFSYAFAMVIGVVILVSWMTIGGGAQ
ncbi:MAG: NADH-quinone oxidoreductase subunit L, partial [Pseudomonadota bacterium]